jgi:tape measure domain-containing protein
MADATRRVSVRLSLDDAAKVKAELRDVGEQGNRSLARIQDGAETASRGLSLLNVAIRGVQIAGLAAGVRTLAKAGDALNQSLSRLQTATGSVGRASEVYATLYRNALQTGVAVSQGVEAFQRFSIAGREIGATSEQVVRLVAGLQRVAIVSGASAGEVSAATLQLGQALASGVLQGDELRSVLEQMPLLAEALAKELGVSIGELRKLGSEGKLTADRVFPALIRAAERVGTSLEQAPLSLGRAFGQLSTATENFLGQLDRAVGLSNALARALSAAARAVDGARRGAGLLDEGERLADLRRQAQVLAGEIGRAESEGVGRPVVQNQPNRNAIRAGLVGAAAAQAGVDRTQRLEELRRSYFGILAEIETAERESLARRIEEQDRASYQAAEARRRRATQDILDLRRDLDDRFRIERQHEERVRRLRDAEAAGAIDAAERQRLEGLATTERDEALRKLEGTSRRVTAARNDERDAEREVNDILRERERLIQANETAYERYARRLESLSRLVERAERIGIPIPDEAIQREAVAALEELETAGRRLGDATDRANDTARELGLTFSSAFEDAVLRGEKLRNVIQGLATDLSRLVLRRTVTEPLANLFGGLLDGSSGGSFDLGKAIATGFGLFGGGGGLKAANGAVLDRFGVVPFARGGIVDSPVLFPFARGIGLMGEAGPEAIMPLRRTRDGRLGVEAAGQSMAITINISSPDADGFRRSRAQVAAAIGDAVRRGARLR